MTVGTVTVIDSTISGNSTGGSGGGIFSFSGAAVNISNSTISGNTAGGLGGGIEARGNLTISNSTISGNSANLANSASGGGGIHAVRGRNLTISSSTISGNVASYGGGIFAEGTATVSSSIVAGNSDNDGAPDLAVATLTVTNSLIGDNGDSGLEPTLDGALDANGNFIGTADAPIDPLLGPLADNGGPTKTMALLPGSPAIDRGANPDNLTNDQRGPPFARTAGSQTDMGAYEVVIAPVVDLRVSVSPIAGTALAGQPYSYIITVSNAGPQDATDVRVTNHLAGGGTEFYEPGKGTPTAGQLAVGASVSFTVTQTAMQAGTYTDTVDAKSKEADRDPRDNTATAIQIVSAPVVDLQVSISPVAGTVLVGQSYSYIITVTNAGPHGATDVRVTNHLAGGGTEFYEPGKGTPTAGQLAVGASVSFTVTQTAIQAGSYTDTVDATANQKDRDPRDNTATVTATVLPVSTVNLQDAVTQALSSRLPLVLHADPVQLQ